jgi:hypothetical protein
MLLVKMFVQFLSIHPVNTFRTLEINDLNLVILWQ